MTPKDELTGSTTTPVIHTIVVNDIPTASFVISANPVNQGVAAEFNGLASKDPDGSITTYSWNFGDGSGAGSGATPSHTYAAPGTYTVTLVVTDSGEQSATTSHSLTVNGIPTVVTGAASAQGQASATLNATVNPNGAEVSECSFEYGTTLSYGASVPCASFPGSGSSAVPVSAPLAGLSSNTLYHFRIVAKNPFGPPRDGTDQMFTTLPNPPTVVTTAASLVTQATATLNATVNPNGGTVGECRFEYGTTPSYGASMPCGSLPGTGESPVAVSATLTGLSANTVYHTRIVATNSGGASQGADQTFTTPQNPATLTLTPTLSAITALVITPNSSFSDLSATLNSKTGGITFRESVGDPGTFSWLLTFQNGKFGVFSAKNTRCKTTQVKLKGKCRPSAIVFAQGSQAVAAPGTVTFTVKPSAAAMKALKNALKQKKGLPVTMTLTFQSARGGRPVSHTQSLTVRLKKK